jgi:hypothetical protein
VINVTKSTKWDQLVSKGQNCDRSCDQVDKMGPAGAKMTKLGWVLTKSRKFGPADIRVTNWDWFCDQGLKMGPDGTRVPKL